MDLGSILLWLLFLFNRYHYSVITIRNTTLQSIHYHNPALSTVKLAHWHTLTFDLTVSTSLMEIKEQEGKTWKGFWDKQVKIKRPERFWVKTWKDWEELVCLMASGSLFQLCQWFQCQRNFFSFLLSSSPRNDRILTSWLQSPKVSSTDIFLCDMVW